MTNFLGQHWQLRFVPTLFLFGFCIARGASSHPSRLGLISSLILQQRVNAKFGMYSSSLQAPVSIDLVWFSCMSNVQDSRKPDNPRGGQNSSHYPHSIELIDPEVGACCGTSSLGNHRRIDWYASWWLHAPRLPASHSPLPFLFLDNFLDWAKRLLRT